MFLIIPGRQATFVQRLPYVFLTSMAFGTRCVVVVQTYLVHWVAFRLLYLLFVPTNSPLFLLFSLVYVQLR